MPAGTYDVSLTNGTVDIGDGILPPLDLNSGTAFTQPLGTDPIAQPIGLTVPSVPVSFGSNLTGASGTLNLTVTGAGVTIDPAAGNVTADATFYATLPLSGKILGIAVSGVCSIGTAQSPVTVHLDTAKGSAWDPATGAFSMVDNTFVVARNCGGLDPLVALLVGNTDVVGDNSMLLNGIATRRPDAPPPATTPPTGTSSQPTTSAPPVTTGNPSEVTPLSTPTATKPCVVPKLVGKTLKQAKRALKKAGCKAGKAKKSKSKKRKGRIVKQRYKAGTKLPAGATVPLTISKGKKQARKQRSR